jgi:(4S)-4-hydroxy-5-phosphonooxypentane-2,3-dione isomerase
MAGFAIVVEFRLKPGARDRFVELVTVNAATSVRDEPGCRRFDILLPEGNVDRVDLYEIYDDAEAFAAHLETPHFKRFKAASAELIEQQTVTRYRVSENAKS